MTNSLVLSKFIINLMSGKSNSKKKEKINFVVGLGRSGFWAAKFLRSMGKKVIVLESKENKHF